MMSKESNNVNSCMEKIFGGGSRLTQAFFQRLRQAELRVEQARQRLDLAYAARNALE